MRGTLEEEFQKRLFVHQTFVLGSYLMHKYLTRKSVINSSLPENILHQKADDYSSQTMEKAMKRGTFGNLYEKAWREWGINLPENFSVIDLFEE